MSIAITSVRSHVGVSETEFTDLTASSLSNPGIFTVGRAAGRSCRPSRWGRP